MPRTRLGFEKVDFKRFSTNDSAEIGWDLYGTVPHFVPLGRDLIHVQVRELDLLQMKRPAGHMSPRPWRRPLGGRAGGKHRNS